MIYRALLVLLVTLTSAPLALPSAGALPENLAEVYSGSLDWEEEVRGVDWSLEAVGVWRLSGFHYKLRGKLELDIGPCAVVIAKNEDGKSGEIVGDVPGGGEHVRSMFMRFNPALVGKLFPQETVLGQGDPRWLVWAKRQYGHKIDCGWQSRSMPVVPWKHSLVFDIDTQEDSRRYYTLDTKKKSIQYEGAFAGRRLARREEGEPMGKDGVAVFRQAWDAFNDEYAMFGIKKDVDWKKLYDQYEPLAKAATSEYELAGVIALLVSHLEDLHVSVTQAGRWVPTYNRFRVLNANLMAVEGHVEDF